MQYRCHTKATRGLAKLSELDEHVALLGHGEEVILGVVGTLVGVYRFEARLVAVGLVALPRWASWVGGGIRSWVWRAEVRREREEKRRFFR